MPVDFVKIKELEEQIQKMLDERPEYREWFENMRAEVDKQAGSDKYNRCAASLNIALSSLMKLPPAAKKLQESVVELQETFNEFVKPEEE